MIEVQRVTKRYGPVAAVNDISFRVEAGQILGFLGPNGAGKTTTMRVLTGYMPPTDGKAIIAGYDVFEQPIVGARRLAVHLVVRAHEARDAPLLDARLEGHHVRVDQILRRGEWA